MYPSDRYRSVMAPPMHGYPRIAPGPVPAFSRSSRFSFIPTCWPTFPSPRIMPSIYSYQILPIYPFASSLSSSIATAVAGAAITVFGFAALSAPIIVTGFAITAIGGLCTAALLANY